MDEASARLSVPGISFDPRLLGFGLAAVRVWQWTSSLFAYTSLVLLFHHSRASRLSQDDGLRVVQLLSLIALIYVTLIICGVHISQALRLRRIWCACAVLSVPGDLAMTGICLANITLLAYTGLPADCHGFSQTKNEGNDLLHQPATGFETSRIGWAWPAALTAELDRFCAFPRTVYGLSVFAIFSYTFSILLSVLYLQQHQQHQHLRTEDGGDHGSEDVEKASQSRRNCYPIKLISFRWRFHAASFTRHAPPPNMGANPLLDTAGQVRPSFFSPPPFQRRQQQPPQEPSMRSFRNRNSHAPTTHSRTMSIASNDSSTSWGASPTTTTLLVSESDAIFLPGPSLPPPPGFWPETIAAGASSASVSPPPPPPQRRWSTSTSSSYNANAFIVADGFPPEAASYPHTPPAYSSPPGSLYHETMKYDGALGLPGLPQQ